MAMSGVVMEENCIDAYKAIKCDQIKCCCFRLSDDFKRIIRIDESQQKFLGKDVTDHTQFVEFAKNFPENECRYGVYHVVLSLVGSDGFAAKRDRIIFVSWAPDTARVKAKMLHSSSKKAIMKKFEGLGIEFQFSSPEEMNAAEWIQKCQDLPNIKMTGNVTHFEGMSVKEWEDM